MTLWCYQAGGTSSVSLPCSAVTVTSVGGGAVAVVVHAVGPIAFGEDSATNVPAADPVGGLDVHDVVTERADRTADVQLIERTARLDAQRDRLERHLHTLDQTQTLATLGRQGPSRWSAW